MADTSLACFQAALLYTSSKGEHHLTVSFIVEIFGEVIADFNLNNE
jgi:hypothetical protein